MWSELVHPASAKIKQDIIKVRGWQVSPAELETILLQHPQILDAAVVGVLSPNSSGLDETVPRAFVVRKPVSGRDTVESSQYTAPPHSPDISKTCLLSELDVVDFVASKVISYKRLTGGVVFVDQIPRSTTGKILRLHLGDKKPASRPKLPPRPAFPSLMHDFPHIPATDVQQTQPTALPSSRRIVLS